MAYEDALKLLEKIILYLVIKTGKPLVGDFVDTLKKALKKQIPIKPQRMTREINGEPHIHTFCPYCYDHISKNGLGLWDCLIDKGTQYCSRCGQKIDWSE